MFKPPLYPPTGCWIGSPSSWIVITLIILDNMTPELIINSGSVNRIRKQKQPTIEKWEAHSSALPELLVLPLCFRTLNPTPIHLPSSGKTAICKTSYESAFKVPSGYVKQFANLKMTIYFVDFPIDSMVDLSIVM